MGKNAQAYFYYNAANFYANARKAWAKIPNDPKADPSIREINAERLSRRICRDEGWDFGGLVIYGSYLDAELEDRGGTPLPSTTDMQIGMSILEKLLESSSNGAERIFVLGTLGTDSMKVAIERIKKAHDSGLPLSSCILCLGDACGVGDFTYSVHVDEETYKLCQYDKAELNRGKAGAGASRTDGRSYGSRGSIGEWAKQDILAGKSPRSMQKLQAEIKEEQMETEKFQVLDAFGRKVKTDEDFLSPDK